MLVSLHPLFARIFVRAKRKVFEISLKKGKKNVLPNIGLRENARNGRYPESKKRLEKIVERGDKFVPPLHEIFNGIVNSIVPEQL